jgi:hypothetical protein
LFFEESSIAYLIGSIISIICGKCKSIASNIVKESEGVHHNQLSIGSALVVNYVQRSGTPYTYKGIELWQGTYH